MPTRSLTSKNGLREIRKPVDKLTVRDFDRCPIWEYATDEEGCEGRDETWVRPVPKDAVPKNSYSQLVSTDFLTRDGRALRGFMVVSTAAKPIEVDPGAILRPRKYCPLMTMGRDEAVSNGRAYAWMVRAIDQTIRAIGGSRVGIFPMSFSLRVLIRGEKALRRGEVL